MKTTKKHIDAAAKGIRLLVLDVDGVLTDGSLIIDGKGNELKAFHVRDGHGIKMLLMEGVAVAIITGRQSEAVAARAAELGIKEVYQRCRVKTEVFERLLDKYGVSEGESCYVGDDIVDIPLMGRVGLPVAVADAPEEVKARALMVTKNKGGRGAVREVADYILRAKGLWSRNFDEYTKA